jgi:hypothetical protein
VINIPRVKNKKKKFPKEKCKERKGKTKKILQKIKIRKQW